MKLCWQALFLVAPFVFEAYGQTGGSFSLTLKTDAVLVAAGGKASVPLQVVGGFSQPIYLIAGPMPEGLSLAVPSLVMAGEAAKIQVSAAATVKQETYWLTVYAAGGGENHSLRFAVTVMPEGTAAPEGPPAEISLIAEPPVASTQVLPEHPEIGAHWVGAWGASAVTPSNDSGAYYLTNVTVRQVAHLSIGTQSALRIKLSNALGKDAVTFGAVHVARWAGSSDKVTSAILPETDRAVNFAKAAKIVIPAGAEVWSDPIVLPLAAGSDLAVTFYIPRSSNVPATMHTFGNQTAFFVLGDAVTGTTLPNAVTDTVRPYLTEIDVDAPGASAVVALGDSLTDGMLSSRDKNARWTDDLAQRLADALPDQIGVLNAGIAGNCLVTACWGPTMLDRFERDVLNVSGVKYVIVLAGVNDISNAPELTAAQLSDAYGKMIGQAHAKGLVVYGGTIPPFGGSNYFSPAHEKLRQDVNSFVRSGGVFDRVIDFDKALASSDNAEFLRTELSGDKIRPNDAGYRAMAEAVDLGILRP